MMIKSQQKSLYVVGFFNTLLCLTILAYVWALIIG